MKYKKQPNKASPLLFLAAQLLVQTVTSSTKATLNGVGLLDQTSSFNGINVSFAGGGEINVSGYDFNHQPASNIPYLSGTIDGSSVRMKGTDLTEDDQFQSAPATGQLVYSNPNISDLFNGVPLTDFVKYGNINFELSFVDSASADTLVCGSASRCNVKYNWNYTPLMYYMSPPVMYPGMLVTAALNPKKTMDYKQSTYHAVEVRIDGEMLDFEDHFDKSTAFNNHQFSRVSGVQESRVRNNDMHPELWFFGAGYSYEWELTAKNCGTDAATLADCYTAKVLPTIASISSNTGSSEGGQLISIEGTSLNANHTLYIQIDGVQCLVQSYTEDKVTCMTQYRGNTDYECTDPTNTVCTCSDPSDFATCVLFPGCKDPNNPVCSCQELDGVEICEFASPCADSSDSTCQCTSISDPSTCWFEPVCKDIHNPACLCTIPTDELTCDFAPACLSSSANCICDDFWDITTCKVKDCTDPSNDACECTCSDPEDLTTCTDCAYKASCLNNDNDDECYCHDLYDESTCVTLPSCTEDTLDVCTYCSDPLDIETCLLSPPCADPTNLACTCTTIDERTTCAFESACTDDLDTSCTCTSNDMNTCVMTPVCHQDLDVCTCTDPLDLLTCDFKPECLDKMDLTCTCTDYSDPTTCSLDLVVVIIPECTDTSNLACVCNNPNDSSTCSYSPACLDVDDGSCVCTDTSDPSTCTIASDSATFYSPRYVVGQQGLTRYTWQNNDVNIGNYQYYMSSPNAKAIWTIPEIAYYNNMVNSVEALTGYFKVPVSGRYRFLMSCDDQCGLYLNRNAADQMSNNRNNAERLIWRGSHTSFRDFYPELRHDTSNDFEVMFSKWVDLTEGEYHYFETSVGQGWGDYHLSVGLEVQPTSMPASHPNMEKQIQRFSVGQTIEKYDTSEIRVSNADIGQGSVVKIQMKAQDVNETLVFSEALPINCTATEMRDGISGFYEEFFGVTPTVTKSYEDVDGFEVLQDDFDVELLHVIVYKIEVRTAISGCTQTTMSVIGWTTAEFAFIQSCDSEDTMSDPPLSGQMVLTCSNTDGAAYNTQPMDVCAGSSTVQSRLETDCSFLFNKISVSRWAPTGRYEMGCEYQLNFWGMDAHVDQYNILSYFPVDPIVGLNLAYTAVIRRNYGDSLIWQMIPAEWFFTAHDVPQLKMWVDNMPALCTGTNCDYQYESQTAEITSCTLSGTDDRHISIVGTNLPLTLASFEMGFVNCVISSNTDTSIECDLDYIVPGGSWLPQVKDENGLVKVASNVLPHDVTSTISTVSPSNLNPAGGQIITVTGTYFPPTNDSRYTYYQLAFEDSTGTIQTLCKILTYSSTELTCLMPAIVTSRRRMLAEGRSTSLIIPIIPTTGEEGSVIQTDGSVPGEGEVEITNSGEGRAPIIIPGPIDIVVEDATITLSSVSETRLSPIGLQTVELCMDSDQATAGIQPMAGMCDNDPPFTVAINPIELELSQLNIAEGPRSLNVVSCDDATGCIEVKYGGAYSGTYEWQIESTDTSVGSVLTSDHELQVVIEISDIQPRESSILGGAELTLTGGVFSMDIEENIVKVGTQWWDGVDHYCYITEVVSPTEVKCRLPFDANREAIAYETIYFSSTFEEGNCEDVVVDGNCLHTFIPITEMPTITGVEAVFNADTEKYELHFSGENIAGHYTPGQTSDVELFVGGEEQTVLSVSDTEIVVQIDSLAGGSEGREAINLYFPKGIPGGYENYMAGVEFIPQLAGLSANEGSIAGSSIEASVPGLGVADSERFTLATLAGEDLCASSSIVEYGKLQCDLIAGEHAAGTEIGIMNLETGEIFSCAATDTTQCMYMTAASGTEPSILTNTLNSSGTEMTIAGENFPTADFDCEVEFAGSTSTSCTINSAGEVIAQWANGAPTFDDPGVEPTLRFIATDGTITNPASGGEIIFNPLTIGPMNGGSDLESSFAGGPLLTIDAQGLAEKVAIGNAVVRVCQQECEFSAQDSTSDTFACAVPAITTARSNELFQITEEQALRPQADSSIVNVRTVIGGSNGSQVLDGSPLPSISGTSSGCALGLKFAQGYVGDLNEFAIFMDYFDTTKVIDQLKFQGSDDNFMTGDDLVTVSDEIHEGWNYYDLDDPVTGTPKYNAYRVYSDTNGGCNDIGEIKLIGFEVINDSNDEIACDVEIVYLDGDTEITAPSGVEQVIYSVANTPIVESVSSRYLDVEGNETLILTGQNLGEAGSEITIDGVPCTDVIVNSATELQCTTGARIGDGNCAMDRSALDVYITDKGNAVAQVTLKYVSLWSKASTWGDQFAPIDGESVSVPACRHLLVDIDESPLLYLVIVDGGSLIFPPDSDPEHVRTFDAHYIMINNGLMEVGTEEDPYCSKLIITMYSEKYDPAMPIYGKKVIGVRFSTLEMHGCPIHPCWTQLETTAEAGQNQVVISEVATWKVGDIILLPSTSFSMNEAELHEIAAIDISSGTTSVITTVDNLSYKHYGEIETYGTEEIDLRGEVGMMTRSIVYRGDPEVSQSAKFGAHIMLHSPGDESAIGKIEYVELQDVGQAFLLGKYPIHFHMIGRVTKSYVRCNTVNRSYNRGTTIHGVHYLTVKDNVYYEAMGHTIFIEDAAETKNLIEHNLVVNTRASHSLLDTDTTPACFWLTHPDNILRGNHAAGCEKYGFWYDMQAHSTGPSACDQICPINAKLGEFKDNVAHTVGRYGLRIFHDHVPREKPCQSISASNPEITAVYENFTAYKCNRSGIMGLRLGAVVFRNAKVADNLNSGIQFDHVVTSDDEANYLDGALIIGTSGNGGNTGHGIITPQTEGWQVKNAHFFNFPTGAAIGQCSHCFDTNMEDTDADTVRFSGLEFDEATVPQRIGWTTYRKGIFHDLDGSLTGMGADSWATTYWKHNDWASSSACVIDNDKYDGLICDSTVTVRKVLFYAPAGGSIERQDLNLWQWDEEMIAAMTEDEVWAYLTENDNATPVPFEAKKNPEKFWAVPYVIPKGGKHTYYGRWGYGHDFEGLSLWRNKDLWTEEDGEIEFIMPFYAIREAIYFDDNTGFRHVNTTTRNSVNVMCENMVYNETFNDTQPKNFTVVVNHFDPDLGECRITGVQCLNNCWDQIGDVEDFGDLGEPQLWSDVSTWTQLPGRIPMQGDDIEIQTNQNIIFDIIDMPVLQSLEVNGHLSCLEGQPCFIHAHSFWIRQGSFNVGSASEPFSSICTITLHGNNTMNYWAFTPQIDSGNKNFVITGQANLYGAARDIRSILLENAYNGNRTIQVEAGLDWVAGDEIALIVSTSSAFSSEHFTIVEYEPFDGIVTLDEDVEFYHFGGLISTAADYSGVDMRSEVLLLTRSITINASTDDISYSLQDVWGCRVLVADFYERDWSFHSGSLNMDYVSVYNCSQRETHKPALAFEFNNGGQSSITNCAIHSGQGEGVIMSDSRNILFKDNTVFSFYVHGFTAMSTTAVTLEGNRIGHIAPDWTLGFTFFEWTDFRGGAVNIEGNMDFTVRDNTAFGANYFGFLYNKKQCDDNSPPVIFENNIAHSIAGYGFFGAGSNRAGTTDCTELSYIKGYKNYKATAHHADKTGHLKCHDIVSIDSGYGIACMGKAGGHIEVYDSVIYGSKDIPNVDFDICTNTIGILTPVYGGGPNVVPKKQKWTKPLSSGGAHGTNDFHNIKFIGFDSRANNCGGSQSAIALNGQHSDYHPITHWRAITFIDSVEGAIIWMTSPRQGWANSDDCGTFTCTGLYNTVAKFEQVTFTGSPTISTLPRSFHVIPDNKESSSSHLIPGCSEKISQWNGWICSSSVDVGVMLIDSLDSDRMTRNQQPIYIQNKQNENPQEELPWDIDPNVYDNRLNAYMDHCWDGMYTCQTREQKFPTLVYQSQDYRIEYTGTPAQKQSCDLHAEPFSDGFMVTIWYPDAGAYTIYDENQELVPPNDWDYSIDTYAQPTGTKGCGENRYEGVKNRLQFWLTPKCRLYIYPRDAIMLSIRLEWTMEAFFEDGGIGTFTNRMAAALGIHAADLKVVQAYEGSVILVFQIFDPNDSSEALQAIKETFEQVIPTIELALGAPVISFNNGSTTTFMDGYDGEDEVETIFDSLINQIVQQDEEEGGDDRVQEVIQIEQRYTSNRIVQPDSSKFTNGVLVIVCVIITVIIICLLISCIFKTFSAKKNSDIHKKIKTKFAQSERSLTKGGGDEDSVFETQKSVSAQKQYVPGNNDDLGDFIDSSRKRNRTPIPEYDGDDENPGDKTRAMNNSKGNLIDSQVFIPSVAHDPVLSSVVRRQSFQQMDTEKEGEDYLPDISQPKNNFVTDQLDHMITKGDRMRMKREDAKAKKVTPDEQVKPKEVQKGPKFMKSKQTVAAPQPQNNFLGSEMNFNDPIEESPLKNRSSSARGGRDRSNKPTAGTPYLKNQVIAGPPPQQSQNTGSKQFL